ncbi:hypothetical protein BIW12_04205 [Flavobacterium commune]|uniref:Uncharacterized protein n=1 Tax=Flavobacterium commune TaxID=1306519 RepID=A0A1D9P851_9FLAO|nr:hypothetical protein BIW12_04205 [Flavobacterium commune]
MLLFCFTFFYKKNPFGVFTKRVYIIINDTFGNQQTSNFAQDIETVVNCLFFLILIVIIVILIVIESYFNYLFSNKKAS